MFYLEVGRFLGTIKTVALPLFGNGTGIHGPPILAPIESLDACTCGDSAHLLI